LIEIRSDAPDDYEAVRELHARAFGGPAEGRLVDLLRAAGKAVVSLVAADQHRVVGHILFSPVTVTEAPERFRAVGLAPISVLPEWQHRGIGSTLVWHGLDACRRQGCDAVVVLGHEKYYPRFGFVKATDFGLQNEYDAIESFMAMELRGGALKEIRGLVTYASEFRRAEC
jgi:putative acetyltransferase